MLPTFLRVLIAATAISACSGSSDDGMRARDSAGGMAGDKEGGGGASGKGAGSGASGMLAAGGADDGGSNGGGRSGSGGDASAAPSAANGEIVVSSFVFYPGPTQSKTFAYAHFHSGPAPSCTKTRYGDCSVSDTCADEPASPAPHAGLITVLSPEPSFSLELPPNSAGVYPKWSQSGAVFTGAESLSISAAGADVPAFHRELTYPLLLIVTEPALPAGESVSHAPRSADLTLRWDRGIAGVLFQVQSSKAPNMLTCTVSSEVGALTIPAAALSRLQAGEELLLATALREQVQAGDFNVSLVVAGVAVTPDKMRRVSIALD